MSDEESFVILGTSPTSSMDTINSLPMASNSPVTKEPIVAGGDLVNGVVKTNGLTVSQLLTSTSSEGSQFSIVQNNDSLALLKMTKAFDEELIADCVSQAPSKILTSSTISKQLIEACENGKPESCHSNGSDNNSMNSTNSAKPEASLAASFILGEVNSDVLKASVYSQFPSICSMSACPEDVVKLQNMMSEYMELKKTLLNTNITMKQLYDQTQKWKADVKAMEDDRRAEIAKMCSRNLKISVVLILLLVPFIVTLPHNHSLSKRSNTFFELDCKGVYNKSMFFRLDRICEDCYQLFRETTVHRLCKQDCFGTEFFEACIQALQLHEEMDKFVDWRDQLGKK
ncbi:uncharacterized protein LOC129913825 isoform X4 [Episyrphus balteatus]|uniref:uncharacterized protein LOC129913825 isoform X4 n=1 Tax=Episyrphus balteatus TaxID=286459 RepID=UPI0024864181|nr:uncharacterized protein LOC129913825 isoform X4 [Episyrphus balteatus]